VGGIGASGVIVGAGGAVAAGVAVTAVAAGVPTAATPGKTGAVSASWSGLLIKNVPSAPVALAVK
jgi:hypothetical protein